ncbi:MULTISPECIES: PTS sugar transporter subunit IIC [Terrabacteria group]|uniref:PTS sugar transporter subunit IIC n=1 Tax=Bacillati TaxID=1783272 RepID=UPI001C6DD9B6|nr:MULTISPECIES: PTS transporter subunit EIIC [Terrabacteria group]MBW9212105.1 PTS transporter subunit EIIC [Trueperella sp. zg.1013]
MSFKDKVMEFFGKVGEIFGKVGQNVYLKTISNTMMGTLGPVMVGSVAVLFAAFPVVSVKTFFANVGLTPIFLAINSVTIGALALYVSFLMAKNLVTFKLASDDGAMAGALSLMAFLIITPLATMNKATVLPTQWLGAAGVFSAMIIGAVIGRIYVLFQEKGWTIKMPASVPPNVSKAFDSLFPAFIIAAIFVVIRLCFQATSYGNMHAFIYGIIQAPLQGIGASLPATILTSFLMQLLWFFGIHGTNVINPIVQPVRLALDAQNTAALAAGTALPNIVGNAFFSIVCWGGSALGLIFWMLKSKSKQYRELGKIALVPALFGITEPVIFGTPLVFNFNFFFPFVLNNSINLTLAYFLTKMGIVARCAGIQPIFGLPLGFHAMVGGSLSIIILQLFIQLVLSPIEWYPWFKKAEREALKQEQATEAEAAK